MVNATAVLERPGGRLSAVAVISRPTADSGCTTCFGTGYVYGPDGLKPCPNGCTPSASFTQQRARLTAKTVNHYRMTARPAPLVVAAGGCLDCGCMCGDGCGCGCGCCPYPHPLPAVIGMGGGA
jgi:hypothetical protein